jgi:hypothetical protein
VSFLAISAYDFLAGGGTWLLSEPLELWERGLLSVLGMTKLSLLLSVEGVVEVLVEVVVLVLAELAESVPTSEWGTGPEGACGAALGLLCDLPVRSDLVLDGSALAVVGLGDKD